ncbi:Ktr system potassium uptake protein A [compost metagenome]
MARKHQQFAVLGLGRFGRSVARTLYLQGHEVLGIDPSEENIRTAHDEEIATHLVQAETTKARALQEAGVADVDAAVVAYGPNLEASIMTVLNVLDLGVKRVIARASSDEHAELLRRIGGPHVQVIVPEQIMGERVANALTGMDILESIALDPRTSIVEIVAAPSLVGKTLREADLRNRHGVIVLAIKSGQVLNVAPNGDTPFKAGDIITLLGPNERLAELKGQTPGLL